MKHHVLVKWNEGVDKASFALEAEKLFSELKKLNGVHEINVFKNCIERSNRYDLLIVIDMDKEVLSSYDESEPHKKWKSDYACFIQSKAIFDCE